MAAKKYSHSVSYVLSAPDSSDGHRLGINSLAVDNARSTLYSASRDGTVCTWKSRQEDYCQAVPPRNPRRSTGSQPSETRPPSLIHQIQAHTHWINDIRLVQNDRKLVSASSDATVRIWDTKRLRRGADELGTTIGRHGDFVKCLASPSPTSTWIASAGLDRKIMLWDLNHPGEKLKLEARETSSGGNDQCSIYALSATPTILASGGPDCMVRMWDARSSDLITKFIGHTDTVRDILISDDGETILSSSSDETIKIWSTRARRCVDTLTMHNHSVWKLHSNCPRLSVFYSSDRSGLIMKTDTRRSSHADNGLSVAVLQEHDPVKTFIANGDYIWTGTQRSSINRWHDVDTSADLEPKTSSFPPNGLSPPQSPDQENGVVSDSSNKLPRSSTMTLSKFATYPVPSRIDINPFNLDADPETLIPVQSRPCETIEGHYGLIKHKLLNDRRRALTQDAAGDVVLWDLLKCAPIKSFGKRHLDEVAIEEDTNDTVGSWCSLDTHIGRLLVTLEAPKCFDATVYADEAGFENDPRFREDQRLNYGKWVLRHLFSGLIEKEIARDAAYRRKLPIPMQKPPTPIARTPATSFDLPPIRKSRFPADSNQTNGTSPGKYATFSKGRSATQGPHFRSPWSFSVPKNQDSPAPTSPPQSSTWLKNSKTTGATDTPFDEEQGEKPRRRSSSIFSRRNFRLPMPFPRKSKPSVTETTPAVEVNPRKTPVEKPPEKEPEYEANLKGVVDKIRAEYVSTASTSPDIMLESMITPCDDTEAPPLDIPARTSLMICEKASGDAVVPSDLYRGYVGSTGDDVDQLETAVPTWLAELLLRNIEPAREVPKITFVLRRYEERPPSGKPDTPHRSVDVARLNAHRMLRAKKILDYIAERFDPFDPKNPNPYKPEEYLELYCQNQFIPSNMTLYAIRTQIWRSGADMPLSYRLNGKRNFPQPKSLLTPSLGSAHGMGNGAPCELNVNIPDSRQQQQQQQRRQNNVSRERRSSSMIGPATPLPIRTSTSTSKS